MHATTTSPLEANWHCSTTSVRCQTQLVLARAAALHLIELENQSHQMQSSNQEPLISIQCFVIVRQDCYNPTCNYHQRHEVLDCGLRILLSTLYVRLDGTFPSEEKIAAVSWSIYSVLYGIVRNGCFHRTTDGIN